MEEITTLAQALVEKATEQGITLSCAESLTGGLLAEAITRVPGASLVFAGCAVTYQTRSKISVLGVPGSLIVAHGAVSAECAAAMAEGARRIYETDYALALTGVAGPEKDECNNAVGTVFIALSGEDGTGVLPLTLNPAHSRDSIRAQAAKRALTLLLDFL